MIKNKDLNEDYFLFSRKKTIHTVKKRSTAKVYLTDFTRSVITRYGNPDPNKPEEYVFNILNTEMDNNEKHIKKKNFNRKINQHFLKFVKSTGINEEISFAWARHSFATIAILSGIRIEAVSNRLNHTSLETTMLYFKGFEEETYRKINDKILEYSRENDLNGHLSIQNSILD